MTRRTLWEVMAGLLLLTLLGGSGPSPALTPALQHERDALMRDGEAALAQGRAQSAVHRFERAVSLQHTADAEIALVRALLQGGQYAQASTYAAHTAGAHRQVAEGALLYGTLLALGGQTAAARRLLDEAAGRFPDDDAIAALRERIGRGEAPDGVGAAVRLRPFAVGEAVPAGARVVASGTLIDGGRHALVPLDVLAAGRRTWVRNGLGRTVAARVERRLPALGLAVQALRPALQVRSLPRALGDEAVEVPLPALAPRDPFPGSPGHVLLYRPADDAAPAWPQLHAGFLGTPLGSGTAGPRRLGIDTPEGVRGGPVLDPAGRWIGVALGGAPGGRLVPVSALRAALGAMAGEVAAAPADAAARPGADGLYETGLRVALQVLSAR